MTIFAFRTRCRPRFATGEPLTLRKRLVVAIQPRGEPPPTGEPHGPETMSGAGIVTESGGATGRLVARRRVCTGDAERNFGDTGAARATCTGERLLCEGRNRTPDV